MNETLKTIASRYSCRAFTDVSLTDEELKAIAAAAIQAPSAMNHQPWKIIVVKNKELMNEMDKEAMNVLKNSDEQATYDRMMSRGGTIFYNAPNMMLIPITPGCDLDCGIVSENIALAAHSLGIQSVICAMAKLCFMGDKSEDFKTRLKFPDEFIFGIAVLLGHAKNPGQPHIPDASKILYVD